MTLSTKQLKYFMTVIKTGSLRKASQKIGVSQPTISAQIASLEKILEVNLLERSQKGVVATAIARSLIPKVQDLLKLNQEIINIAKDAGKTPSGTHNLGVPPTLGPYFLPDVIPDIHKKFPSLRLFVKEDTPGNLERGLLEGDYDVILTPLPFDIKHLDYEPLFAEPLYVVSAPDNELAEKKAIKPKDFIGEHFLVVEERHRFFAHIQQLAKDFGFNLLRDYEGTSLDTLRQMIGIGMGVSFLPALYIRSEITPRQDVVTLDLDFKLPKREIAIAWRVNSSQKNLYKDFAKTIRNICQKKLSSCIEVF